MLEIFFCNVGDGDAALITEHRPDQTDYTVLVDAGRPFLEPKQGSLRKEAIYYLKARRVSCIDLMILSHLHIDHVGGAQRILETIPVKRLVVPSLPPEDAEWVTPSFDCMDKPVNGLCQMLNIFCDLIHAASERGISVEPASSGTELLTGRLKMTTFLPRQEVRDRQAAMFRDMYHNVPVLYEDCYKVSKERNVSSLMQRFEYAGRSVLFTGDRYAKDFEEEPIAPCDILKLPHHGDPKSMTEKLLKKLSPRFAVISCQNDPEGKKDRPNAEIVSLLQDFVPEVLCTENKAFPTFPASTHNGIRFEIGDDGSILCRFE